MSQIDKPSQGRVDFDNNGALGENEFLRLMRMQKDWRFFNDRNRFTVSGV